MSDAAWNFDLAACRYKPKLRLRDNWGWCTARPGAGGTPNTPAFCESDDAWITFADTADIFVLVR